MRDRCYEADFKLVERPLIKWLDRKNGVCRILDTEAITKMWVELKRRKKSSYANMMRGVRYSRKENLYFDEITRENASTCGYKYWGKKHLFKFGREAARNCQYLARVMENWINNSMLKIFSYFKGLYLQKMFNTIFSSLRKLG